MFIFVIWISVKNCVRYGVNISEMKNMKNYKGILKVGNLIVPMREQTKPNDKKMNIYQLVGKLKI